MDADLESVARRLVWWKAPADVDLLYLVRRVMDLGTWDMIQLFRTRFGESIFRQALATAEPGSFSSASWNYWHIMFDLPVRPLPTRVIPDSPYVAAELGRTPRGAA